MKTGLDRVVAEPTLARTWGNFAVVTHATTTTSTGLNCVEALSAIFERQGQSLQRVFGPQHGYWQCEPYNMFETPDDTLELRNGRQLPLHSLYGETREPQAKHLNTVDTLVLDLPDIGCRIYTYMTTLAACLNQAARLGKQVVVLDRPNPIGLSHKEGQRFQRVEGNILEPTLKSFVGWFRIPFRHGLSLGELGALYIEENNLHVDYEVITVEGLDRSDAPAQMASLLPQMASPNMPHSRCMSFFPLCVALEGTNVSEGRGTCAPFQLLGAPFLNEHKLLNAVEAAFEELGESPCVNFTPMRFMPRFDKFQDQICHGLFLSGSPEAAASVFPTSIALLAALACSGGQALQWREKGYEYNFSDNPLDLILGTSAWRRSLETLRDDASSKQAWSELRELLHRAQSEAQAFAESCENLSIYPSAVAPST